MSWREEAERLLSAEGNPDCTMANMFLDRCVTCETLAKSPGLLSRALAENARLREVLRNTADRLAFVVEARRTASPGRHDLADAQLAAARALLQEIG